MENNGFESIMRTITAGLTGDREHDEQYLYDTCTKYKDHPLAQEILRACGRLIYDLVSDEQKNNLNRIIGNENASYDSVMEEVRFKMHQGKFEEALPLMESLIRRIEDMGFYKDDSVSEYRCFSSFFELLLYNAYSESEKKIRKPGTDLFEIYGLYGCLLVDLKRYDDARAALLQAKHWNPVSANICFELAETSKLQNDMEAFFRISLEAFKYAYEPKLVARCLRNLGYYFVEQELWKEAIACNKLSMQYTDAANAASELYYIHQKTGIDLDSVTADEAKEYSKKHGFPCGPHPDVVGIALSFGKHFLETKDDENARYCWTIAYNLTKDEQIRKLLDILPKAEEHD